MSSFRSLYQDLLDKKISVDDLIEDQADFMEFASKVTKGTSVDIKELKAFLRLCLDFYTYSNQGRVLIPDYTYDLCMNKYYEETGIDRLNDTMFLADDISSSKKWEFINHEIPGMVGTISDKLYSYDEIKARVKYYGTHAYTIAPKYDGISVALKVVDGKLKYGATRYDGMKGQNITALVKRAKFPKWFRNVEDGFYKCEILMATDDYNELIKDKHYANRRSAVSGIVNTPSNLDYARFLTIMPLMYYNPQTQERRYIAEGMQDVLVYSTRDLMDAIEGMLNKIRDASYPYRVDGVVAYPHIAETINEGDLLQNAFAYKVNTNEAKTTIKYVYPSVGRLGTVTPMAKVRPVEVNETMVSDVSFGSYAKFSSMGLTENEEVIVFSAGDVIPQIKAMDVRTNWTNEPELKMSKYCPYCGERFDRINTEYKCVNPNCMRVQTGLISNFIVKLGVIGFSDKTIEMLYKAGLIRTIPDLFKLTPNKIVDVDGFDMVSATNFYNEIQRIKNERLQVSEFFGALGIEGISTKKCRKILSEINLSKLMNKLEKDKNPYKIEMDMRSAEGIGKKTATVFIDFVARNLDMIQTLMNTMNIVGDQTFSGEICFTGFRNSRWEEKFNSIGYKIGDNVTKNTTCLIAASDDNRTTKSAAALKKGIPIFPYRDIELVYDRLKDGRSLSNDEYSED